MALVKEGEQRLAAPKLFTLYVDGGETLFKAHCPELDITSYGESSEIARTFLLFQARAEIAGILEGKGGAEDERLLLAQRASRLLGGFEIGELFQKAEGPAPQHAGMK